MKYSTIVFAFTIVLLVSFCSRKDENQKKEQLEEHSLSMDESVQQPWIHLNIDSLATTIDQFITEAALSPNDLEKRKQLVSYAIDQANHIIYATGTGIPQQQAASPSIALNYAKKAAKMEALRWATYINQWRTDISYSPFGSDISINANGQILKEIVQPDNSVKVLIYMKY
ncbi:hypothetical protein JW960_12920 [candidate division KSB1 bacterium]|nr:hypothetical protein [candidate division KSB1 bacterium]